MNVRKTNKLQAYKEEYVNAKQEVRREDKHDIYNNHRGFMQIRRWMNRESLFEIVLNA